MAPSASSAAASVSAAAALARPAATTTVLLVCPRAIEYEADIALCTDRPNPVGDRGCPRTRSPISIRRPFENDELERRSRPVGGWLHTRSGRHVHGSSRLIAWGGPVVREN